MNILPERLYWVLEAFEPEGDPWGLLQIARDLEAEGNLEGAAAVIDRAYGIDPGIDKVRQARAALLDRLAVREHGLVFRYVPAGPFLMGSSDGEDDEKPLHPVWLAPFWLCQTPVSWSDYCRLLGWEPPPAGVPRGEGSDDTLLDWENWLRAYYCEELAIPSDEQQTGPRRRSRRRNASEVSFANKPMVAVSWQDALELVAKISTPGVRYSLPTEAQWEKAARGGLIGARHSWGNEPPSPDNCDFDRYHAWTIRRSFTFPPNGYGLYAMNGGVWEWTADWYDRDYYRDAPEHDPRGPDQGEEKVLRGGSWADCAEVVTVSFRMSRASSYWRDDNRSVRPTPTIGFRLCREEVGAAQGESGR
jgi:formylglycine-generating enzyme required for sulfatase activity